MPLGVELSSFSMALCSPLLIVPLKLVSALPWAVTSLGGLLAPLSWLFNWLSTVILFSLA
jgi:putative membrane protein